MSAGRARPCLRIGPALVKFIWANSCSRVLKCLRNDAHQYAREGACSISFLKSRRFEATGRLNNRLTTFSLQCNIGEAISAAPKFAAGSGVCFRPPLQRQTHTDCQGLSYFIERFRAFFQRRNARARLRVPPPDELFSCIVDSFGGGEWRATFDFTWPSYLAAFGIHDSCAVILLSYDSSVSFFSKNGYSLGARWVGGGWPHGDAALQSFHWPNFRAMVSSTVSLLIFRAKQLGWDFFSCPESMQGKAPLKGCEFQQG